MPGAETAIIELLVGEDKAAGIRKILKTDPDIVGFSTYSVGYHEVVAYCNRLKFARPGLSVWLGGPHVTSLPMTIPSTSDIGVIGEGEETFLKLCREWMRYGELREEILQDMEGICYRKDGRVHINPRRDQIRDLDSIPPPDISLLDMEWYTKAKRFFVMNGFYRGFVILSSRGCPYDCRFCQASAHWGPCRFHSAERVVSEIEMLRERHSHINAINIIDDLFIADKARLRNIVGLIRKNNLHDGIAFNVNGRANLINEETMMLLKSMNVVQISYGFESGSEKILDFLKKGSVHVSQNETASDLTNRHGIGVGGQFMIGTPGETEEDIRKTIDFINTHKLSHAHLSVTMPLPGTALWEDSKNNGLVSEEMDWRKLDFGNPNNPHLLYCNEETIPFRRFQQLLKEAQRACDRWNPGPSWREYLSYVEIYAFREFTKKAFARLFSWRRKSA